MPPYALSGHLKRHDHRSDNDYYSQAGNLFRLMNQEQKDLLTSNIAAALGGVPSSIAERQIDHFRKADPAYGEGVAKHLSHAQKADTRQVPASK